MRINTFPSRFLHAHNTSPTDDVYATPNADILFEPNFSTKNNKIDDDMNVSEYHTPKGYSSQISNNSTSSTEEYKTPDNSLTLKKELFPPNFVELRKSCSSSVVDQRVKSMSTIKEHVTNHLSDYSSEESGEDKTNSNDYLARSKSDYELPRPIIKTEQKSHSLWAFLTPHLKRKNSNVKQSTPNKPNPGNLFKVPNSPIQKRSLLSLPETSTSSLNSLKSGVDAQQLGVKLVQR